MRPTRRTARGALRQAPEQERAIPAPGRLVAARWIAPLALLASGCGAGPSRAPGAAERPAAKPRTIEAGPGSMAAYADRPARSIAFEVAWREALAAGIDQAHVDLQLRGVSGTLYRLGRPAAFFKADAGTADKAAGRLRLRGRIKLTSAGSTPLGRTVSLRCDQIDYATADEIIKASGRVSLEGAGFRFGDFDALWCSNDLKRVATPDRFPDVRHNPASQGTTR